MTVSAVAPILAGARLHQLELVTVNTLASAIQVPICMELKLSQAQHPLVLAVISSQGNIDICLCRDAHRAVLPCTSARSDDAVRIYGVPLLIIVRFMALRC